MPDDTPDQNPLGKSAQKTTVTLTWDVWVALGDVARRSNLSQSQVIEAALLNDARIADQLDRQEGKS